MTRYWRVELYKDRAKLFDITGNLVGEMSFTHANFIASRMNWLIDQEQARMKYVRKIVKVGDKISRNMCGGRKGTFTFTGFEGDWLCGKTVNNCHLIDVYAINGVKV